jgi:hypothetical protein
VAVSFGSSSDDFELRWHQDLQRRQDVTSSAATSSTELQSVALSTSTIYPSLVSGTPTPTITSISKAIHTSWVDTTILPPELSLGPINLTGPAPYVSYPFDEKLQLGLLWEGL